VIAPGISLSAEALFARAARLPKTEIAKPPQVLGRNTVQSMQSGLVYGCACMVDGMVERLQAEMGYPCAVLATGGEARLIESESKAIQEATSNHSTAAHSVRTTEVEPVARADVGGRPSRAGGGNLGASGPHDFACRLVFVEVRGRARAGIGSMV
jgi:type III pantothenate kinase